MLCLDHKRSYRKDKRDMWTLQRELAEEALAKKVADQDSGRGSTTSRTSTGSFIFRQISGFLRSTTKPKPKPKTQTLKPVNLGISGKLIVFCLIQPELRLRTDRSKFLLLS